MQRYLTFAICALACCRLSNAAEDALSRQIADFELRDTEGKAHTLAQLAGERATVLVFLGIECPLAKLYAPRLAALAHEYESRGVRFVGIDANRQDSSSELDAYAQEHNVGFALLTDQGNQVADQLGAERTPEAFVLDHDRVVRYQGRIDDQYDVGIQRPRAAREDLRLAIEQVLAGRPVTVPRTPTPGCFIGRMQVRSAPSVGPAKSAVTWSEQISRIVQKRCQDCHRPGEFAPFSLLTYDDAVGWAETIREVVSQNRMPPWNTTAEHGKFANDLRLSSDEKALILAWVDAGAPEGDSSKLPPPRTFVEGWRIGKPDQIVHMSAEPYAVPATGVVDYQWFYVDPGFTEDKWVQAVEARPGCVNVVHHITVYFKPPGGQWDMRHNDRINLLGGFNPGGEALVLPEGTAIHLPAGTELAFEMHYTPDGVPRKDNSYVGLRFADPGSVRKEVRNFMPADTAIAIPPGDADYRSTISYRLADDMDLLLMRPHMHLRGKAFRYEAKYPDGRSETLLEVPAFDFNWQHSYYLAKPKRLPKGTELVCTAEFDNSANNPTNPDPTVTVRWGDQSWDEMMIGIFSAVLAHEDLQKHPKLTAWGWPWRLGLWALFLSLVAGLLAGLRMQMRPRWARA